jgi:hypothetical protein
MENWKDVAGYEGFYQVSTLGRMRSVDRLVTYKNNVTAIRKGTILRPGFQKEGYPHYVLSRNNKVKSILAHKAVLEAFIGPRPSGMQACHWDGCHGNAALSNLRWDTPPNNYLDSVRLGKANMGRRNGSSKLNEQQVREIRAASGSQKDIASLYGISQSKVSKIRRGVSWGWLA